MQRQMKGYEATVTMPEHHLSASRIQNRHSVVDFAVDLVLGSLRPAYPATASLHNLHLKGSAQPYRKSRVVMGAPVIAGNHHQGGTCASAQVTDSGAVQRFHRRLS